MTHITLEDNLKKILQRTISIYVDGKLIREGKFILYNIKDYYIQLIFKTKGKNKIYEIPYPFANNLVNKNLLIFNYKVVHIHNNNPDILKHQIFVEGKRSKFYNKIVEIKIL